MNEPKYPAVKIVRRIIQWSLFLVFFVSFLSFIPAGIPGLSGLLPKLQFFPAIRRFPVVPLGILALTLVFGRVYCSTICPLATVQDAFIGGKRRFSFRKLSLLTRYLVPALSLVALFAGFPAVASVVDPYSMTGRMVSSINELVILPVIDLIGYVLRRFSVYITTYPIQFRWITIAVSVVSAAVVFVLSRIGGRLYCNTLCPVGAVLSIPARWSIFGIRISTERCTACGSCENVCKAEAIDASSRFIDTSKCVSCFDCMGTCRFGALKYGVKEKTAADRAGKERISTSRRDFLRKTATGTVLALGFPVLARAARLTKTSAAGAGTAVPPGSGSRTDFLSKCVSCSLCVSRCPGNVLQPAGIGPYGITGAGVPFMDYNRGSCEFECSLCTDLCPSGAIRHLELEDKKRVRIGTTKFVREFCVVETDGTSCGACGEICPTGAIDMLHIGDGPDGALEIPVVNNDFCIGCGACQFVCPVIEKNTIFIEALEIHDRADVREDTSDDAPVEVDNEFAF